MDGRRGGARVHLPRPSGYSTIDDIEASSLRVQSCHVIGIDEPGDPKDGESYALERASGASVY